MHLTDPIISKKVEEVARERAEWIDKTIKDNVPKWKLNFLLKHKRFSVLWARLLGVNVMIEHETLIADFGIKTTIWLNKRVVGQKKFKEMI